MTCAIPNLRQRLGDHNRTFPGVPVRSISKRPKKMQEVICSRRHPKPHALGPMAWAAALTVVLLLPPGAAEPQTAGKGAVSSMLSITVIFNNVAFDPKLETSWGLSCLVTGTEKTILFDTGGDGRILLQNMAVLGLSPQAVDTVFLSHAHGDHVNGLWEFLKQNSRVEVLVPDSFPQSFTQLVNESGAQVMPVRGPAQICPEVYSTGEMGFGIKEQAMILESPRGLIVITGCAHPGIVNIVRQAIAVRRQPVYMVMGGFHLMGYSEAQTREVINQLTLLGVEKVGPSHCTGDMPRSMFKAAWGGDCLDLGCGAHWRMEHQH